MKAPCPKCPSSDGFEVYPDGHGHCFVCGHHVRSNQIENNNPTPKETRPLTPLPDGKSFQSWLERGLTARTLGVFGVTHTKDRTVYPLFDGANNHVAEKIRMPDKKFLINGDFGKAVLFGQQVFPAGGKYITLVEGQDDAMAFYQMSDYRYPAVSVHSASTAERDVKNNYEYLNSFEKIYICFDNDKDKPQNIGQEKAQAVAGLFPLGKAHIVCLRQHKDANDYLLANKAAEFNKEWWASPVYKPDGLRLGVDLWTDVSETEEVEGVKTPFETINSMTYGLRLKEFVVVTAETGVGKTSFMKELEVFVLRNTNRGVGFMHLEESNADTALGLMSVAADKPLHIPESRQTVSNEDLRRYFDDIVNTERVVIWDHFGSNDIDKVIEKIHHMHALGCKYIVLDHLSILISANEGDDRKSLDAIVTRLKSTCMELNICVLAVIQQNRSGQIRGSAGVEHVANTIIKLSRDLTEKHPWRRNVTTLTITKNRFCGRTGPAGYIYYDPETGRLRELTELERDVFERGEAVQDSWP